MGAGGCELPNANHYALPSGTGNKLAAIIKGGGGDGEVVENPRAVMEEATDGVMLRIRYHSFPAVNEV